MNKNIWGKRIPTLLGLIILIVGVVITSNLVKGGLISFIIKANPAYTPENIRITNVSDNSFTVSYVTKDSVLGSVSLIGENLNNTYIDDKDQRSGNITPYKIHNVTVRNLKPLSKYFFTITSKDTVFFNNGNPFEITTATSIESPPPSQKPIVGKVVLPDGTNPAEAVVYLTAENAQALSTMVKSDGSYIIPLNSILNHDLNSYFLFSDDLIIKMLIVGPENQSNITLLAKQINPVPVVTLSKDYDFKAGNTPAEQSQEEASKSAQVNFPSFSANPVLNTMPQILNPKNEQGLTDQQPIFKGTASPGADVKIIIHSPNEIQTKVIADKSGKWSYRPKQPLSPGEHIISIITKDKFGISKVINQQFTVYAAGTQVSESATPSATPVITLTSTPNTPIPTSPPRLSSSPTLIPSPTFTVAPTIVLSFTPTSSPVITNPPGKKPSPPGSSSALMLGIGAVITTGIGVLLFLLTRGTIPSL